MANKKSARARWKRVSAAGLLTLIILFELTAFALLAFRESTPDVNAFILGGILVVLLLFQYLTLTSIFRHLDRYILIIANLLVAIGLIVQYRIDPEIAFRQVTWFAVGMVAMYVCILLMRRPNFFRKLTLVIMIACAGVMMALFVLGSEKYGATNWIIIGDNSLQPSELVKAGTVFILAHWLANAKRLRGIWPLLLYVVAVVGMLVLQRDLGAAVLIALTALIVFYVATGNKGLTVLGLGAGCAGAVAGYFMFDHVRVRVAIWKNPWATYTGSGYQIAQGLMAIASGGVFGMGLTRGSPKLIPAYHTDYIFAVICEEFGIIFGVAVIALYLALIVRGALVALNAPDRYTMLIAFGCTVLITLQSFIIIAGVIKLIPLTGITMPFVSYGGSSLLSSMILLGILEGVAIAGGETLEKSLREIEV
ncbi:MAG: FtsW/RodA/SpoVE family cell cycle protein [Clostridiales bacterium]|jgi:cell division protein FtsW (lipid II flippase)|nr:FtsW/RodA/SpoVE family cell cycle protein [Clostridiales bacterium]